MDHIPEHIDRVHMRPLKNRRVGAGKPIGGIETSVREFEEELYKYGEWSVTSYADLQLFIPICLSKSFYVVSRLRTSSIFCMCVKYCENVQV